MAHKFKPENWERLLSPERRAQLDPERVLGTRGRLAVLEWVPKQEDMGPPLEERVAESEVVAALGGAGFAIIDRRALNASQYLVFASPEPRHRTGDGADIQSGRPVHRER